MGENSYDKEWSQNNEERPQDAWSIVSKTCKILKHDDPNVEVWHDTLKCKDIGVKA